MHFTKDMHRHALPVLQPAPGRVLGGADHNRPSAYRAHLKRLFDVGLILATAPLVIPVMAILAALIGLGGRNPFYTQRRIGLHGRIYTMWKFRSMVRDADAALARHLQSDPAARAEWDHTQKLKHDPRITRTGRILRKTSLDELPQLLNVLRGEMSLVGPRPMLPEQQIMYPGTAYYKMLPGITGPWQVSARNETAFADRAAFDTSYHSNCSFFGDLKTLLATVVVVTRATGY